MGAGSTRAVGDPKALILGLLGGKRGAWQHRALKFMPESGVEQSGINGCDHQCSCLQCDMHAIWQQGQGPSAARNPSPLFVADCVLDEVERRSAGGHDHAALPCGQHRLQKPRQHSQLAWGVGSKGRGRSGGKGVRERAKGEGGRGKGEGKGGGARGKGGKGEGLRGKGQGGRGRGEEGKGKGIPEGGRTRGGQAALAGCGNACTNTRWVLK